MAKERSPQFDIENMVAGATPLPTVAPVEPSSHLDRALRLGTLQEQHARAQILETLIEASQGTCGFGRVR